MYMGVFDVCMPVATCPWCSHRPEEGVGAPKNGMSCYLGAENQT